MKFENYEFIFAIRGPKLAKEGVQDKFFKHKIGAFSFTCTLGMTWRGQARGSVHPNYIL